MTPGEPLPAAEVCLRKDADEDPWAGVQADGRDDGGWDPKYKSPVNDDREGPPEHPMPAPPGSPLIYVDNLEASMDNEALYDTFRLFGGVLTCKVACDEDGKSKRSGVVLFESADSAQEASERVDGMQIGGRTVVVKQLSNAEARSFLTSKCGGAFFSFRLWRVTRPCDQGDAEHPTSW